MTNLSSRSVRKSPHALAFKLARALTSGASPPSTNGEALDLSKIKVYLLVDLNYIYFEFGI